MKKVRILINFVYIIPVLVILFEYVAVTSALAFARFAVEAEQPVISLLGGIIRVGGNLPYDAVPNTVVTLHLLGLFLIMIYFIHFVFFSPWDENRQPTPPSEG